MEVRTDEPEDPVRPGRLAARRRRPAARPVHRRPPPAGTPGGCWSLRRRRRPSGGRGPARCCCSRPTSTRRATPDEPGRVLRPPARRPRRGRPVTATRLGAVVEVVHLPGQDLLAVDAGGDEPGAGAVRRRHRPGGGPRRRPRRPDAPGRPVRRSWTSGAPVALDPGRSARRAGRERRRPARVRARDARRRRHDLPGLPRPAVALAAGQGAGRRHCSTSRPRPARPRARPAPHRRRHAVRRRPGHGDVPRAVGRGPRRRPGVPALPTREPLLVVPTPGGRRFTQELAAEYAAPAVAGVRLRPLRGHRPPGRRALPRPGCASTRSPSATTSSPAARSPCWSSSRPSARLLPGVLGNAESAADDSFAPGAMAGLLEAPVYTKPPVWRGLAVPEVLRSGDHGAVARVAGRAVPLPDGGSAARTCSAERSAPAAFRRRPRSVWHTRAGCPQGGAPAAGGAPRARGRPDPTRTPWPTCGATREPT